MELKPTFGVDAMLIRQMTTRSLQKSFQKGVEKLNKILKNGNCAV